MKPGYGETLLLVGFKYTDLRHYPFSWSQKCFLYCQSEEFHFFPIK